MHMHRFPWASASKRPDQTLEAENKAFRTTLAAKEELIAAKGRHIEDLSQALRLLTGPPSTPQRQMFWQRLFGCS